MTFKLDSGLQFLTEYVFEVFALRDIKMAVRPKCWMGTNITSGSSIRQSSINLGGALLQITSG